MLQNKLFHDSIYDALGADVAACGGIKKVAGMLWPALETTVAAARLRSGLNPEHAQKLDPEEVMRIKRIAKEHESTATVEYEDAQLGKESAWINPEDEAAKIDREINEKLDVIVRQLQRRDSLRSKSQLRVAK